MIAPRPRASSSRAGFTLVELLVVVVIVAILAAIAVPAFVSQVRRTQMLDCFRMVNAIRIAEDSWYSRQQQYLATPFNPAASPSGTTLVPFDTAEPSWRRLGVVVDGMQRFQYRVLAGTATTPWPAGVTLRDGEPWYVVQALGDLDGDGTQVFVEAYPESEGFYIGSGLGGPSLPQGWE